MSVTTAQAASGESWLWSCVRAAAKGDQSAFKNLYDQYANSVYNLVLRCLRNSQAAEDVCQEIWVKAYRELHRLDEPQAFPAWLYRIASRACVDAARKNRRFPATAELNDYSAPPSGDDPERSALRNERVRLTWEALAALPARQHLALFLREMDRRSYKEIAQILETSEAAVETLLFRARQAFARAYERLDAAVQDRCEQAHRTMAALMDGEATPVQTKAVHAHVDACTPCSAELSRMQQAAARYAALAPLPVPALIGERVFESLGLAGAAGSSTGMGKLLVLSAAKAKLAAVSLVATTAITATVVATPAGGAILPGSGSPEAVEPPRPGEQYDAVNQEGETATGGAVDEAADGIEANTQPDTLANGVPDINEALNNTTQTVDSILHEIEATANEVVPLPAVPAVPEVIPSSVPMELPAQPPAVPSPLPTVPPLP